MKLGHVAVWTRRLEEMKNFYVDFFKGIPNEKYIDKDCFEALFESYFLDFGSGAKLEIMQMPTVQDSNNALEKRYIGLTHYAFAFDTRKEVDELTDRIKKGGYVVLGEPHETGDGYYESSVLDPDGNIVELTVEPVE